MDVRAEFTKAHKFEAKCRKLEQRSKGLGGVTVEGKSSWGWVALNWSVKGENFVINGAMKLTLTAIVLFKHILLSVSCTAGT